MACTPDFSEPHAALERISQLEAEIESLRKQNSRLLDALLDALPHATPQPIFVPYAPPVPAPPLVPYASPSSTGRPQVLPSMTFRGSV